MSYRVRERIIFDVIDESSGDTATTTVSRETAEAVAERLNAGALQHTPDPGDDAAPRDTGATSIT